MANLLSFTVANGLCVKLIELRIKTVLFTESNFDLTRKLKLS